MPTAVHRSAPRPSTAPVDLARSLGWYRHGRGDPTTRIDATSMTRACWTPDGPATVVLDWADGTPRPRAWGPGADWAAARALEMTGLDTEPAAVPDADPRVTELARRLAGLRTGASGDLYSALLPTIVEQRITSGEACRQWARLCHELGDPAPGPDLGMRLPPAPERLARRPAWWFHPLGIEAKRARPLAEIGRLADRLWAWAHLPLPELAAKLSLVAGVGPWTVASVLGPVRGDDDAVIVGDYHLPNLVAWNLAGEARADDARMLELLEPYRGARGRVVRLLGIGGSRPPAFGPRHRVLPMHRW